MKVTGAIVSGLLCAVVSASINYTASVAAPPSNYRPPSRYQPPVATQTPKSPRPDGWSYDHSDFVGYCRSGQKLDNKQALRAWSALKHMCRLNPDTMYLGKTHGVVLQTTVGNATAFLCHWGGADGNPCVAEEMSKVEKLRCPWGDELIRKYPPSPASCGVASELWLTEKPCLARPGKETKRPLVNYVGGATVRMRGLTRGYGWTVTNSTSDPCQW